MLSTSPARAQPKMSEWLNWAKESGVRSRTLGRSPPINNGAALSMTATPMLALSARAPVRLRDENGSQTPTLRAIIEGARFVWQSHASLEAAADLRCCPTRCALCGDGGRRRAQVF